MTFAFHSERNGWPPGAGRGLGFSFLLHEPYLRHQLLRHMKERGERVLPLSEVIFPGFGCQDAARCDDVEPGMRLLGQREFRRECAGGLEPRSLRHQGVPHDRRIQL